MAEYLIKDGTILDGTGSPGIAADVLIEGDVIKAVEPFIQANGAEVINARGKVVCPGIIDAHSHGDLTIFRSDHNDLLAPLVRQGITTFIGGNCGMSMAPLSRENYGVAQMYIEGFTARELDEEVDWTDSAGFMDHLDKHGQYLNCALLAPHGLIRIDAMGMEPRAADEDELRTMCRTLDAALDAGCIGMSTGLQYMPGLQCETGELVRLGRTLARYDGIYVSHLRSYMNALDKAVDELATVARENDIRAQISHIFWVPEMGALGPLLRGAARMLIELSRVWTLKAKLDSEIEEQINRFMRMRGQGVRISMDVMPTTTTFTHLMAYFPPWVLVGDKEAVGRRLMDPAARRRIRRDIENGKMVWPHTGRNSWSLNIFKILGWDCTRIMSVVTEKNRPYEGMRISDIAREQGKRPLDAACDLLVEEEGRILVFSSVGEPEDNFTEQSIFAAIEHPEVSVSTDTVLLGVGKPSHLFHGAYPKLFSRYVRNMKLLDLTTAVRKVTGLPAEHFGLRGRGFIRKGCFADVLVFDPETIEPNCDFCRPQGVPCGIEHVFINGVHVLDQGRLDLDARAGRLLRRQ